ncbi:MAG TPA: hypothetical protein ENJ09_00245 [Planctomycetes bacterium]|nr:hypothetical protein [Planctomycetota bacterium]
MSKLADIDGAQKVAALLLSLDVETRASVLGKMREDVVDRVAAAMLELDPRLTEGGVVDLLKESLAKTVHGQPTIRPLGERDLSEILSRGLGKQRAEALLKGIIERRAVERPFRIIEEHPPHTVGRVLREESNAVAALVLSHLDPGVSAEILKVYDEEQGVDVVKRMATLDPPVPDVLRRIAQLLHEKIQNTPAAIGVTDPAERLKAVADLLNKSKPEMEKGVVEAIAEEDTAIAQELREYMFTWEDVATIDSRTMQKILGTVDTKTLSIALKGCSEEVEANLLSNLSSRVKDMVMEERELAGPVPMSEVLQARDDIMKNIRAMIEAGEYRPAKGGDDLVS